MPKTVGYSEMTKKSSVSNKSKGKPATPSPKKTSAKREGAKGLGRKGGY